MEEAIKKADVLIEAMPYLREFRGKAVVIKFGGAALEDNRIRKGVLEDILFLNVAGAMPLLVHGGGPSITKRMQKEGLAVKFVEGRRATDAKTMKVVDEVLSELNSHITDELRALGADAVGVHGKSGKAVIARGKKIGSKNLGHAGEVAEVDASFITKALNAGTIPVISPVSAGADKKLYNVNADEVAAAVACALSAEKLVLLTNVRGIMTQKDNESTVLSTLTITQAQDLLKRRIINAGMLPKVDAAIAALSAGVKKVHIIDWRLPHSILLEIFTKKGIGTEIIRG